MPLVRKRALHDDSPSKDQPQPKPQKKAKRVQTEYTEFDRIGYTQDQFHSLFRTLPAGVEELQKLLSQQLGSFLNGKGGILCFGVRENGTIYGVSITRMEEDNLKVVIDKTMAKFHPLVHTSNYRVSFTPVRVVGSRRSALQVLEIRINPGDGFDIYEDMNHQVYVRKAGGIRGPLTPHEIKLLTVQQLRKKMEEEESIANTKNRPSSTPCASEVKSNDVKSNEVKSNEVKSNEVKSNEVKSNEVKSNEVKSNEDKSSEVKKEMKLDNSASRELRPKPHSTNQPKRERQRIVRPPPRPPVLKQSTFPPHPSYYPQHIQSSRVPQYQVLPLPPHLHNHLVLPPLPHLLKHAQHASHSPWYTDNRYHEDGFIYHH